MARRWPRLRRTPRSSLRTPYPIRTRSFAIRTTPIRRIAGSRGSRTNSPRRRTTRRTSLAHHRPSTARMRLLPNGTVSLPASVRFNRTTSRATSIRTTTTGISRTTATTSRSSITTVTRSTQRRVTSRAHRPRALTLPTSHARPVERLLRLDLALLWAPHSAQHSPWSGMSSAALSAASQARQATTSKADKWALSTFFPACPAPTLTRRLTHRCSSTSSSSRRPITVRCLAADRHSLRPHRA